MRSAAPTPTHRRPLRRTSGVLFAGALALTLTATPALSVVADAAPDAPTNATTDPAAGLDRVTGPLPVTAGSYPFGAADHQMLPQDLAAIGYVEEEYLVSGLSNVYTWPETGPAEVITPDAPYTTRVLVRRPASSDQFSGNAVVEMLNPSNLFDLNIGWGMTQEQIVANGDAWIGITAKPVAVDALQTFDPERYGALNWANPRSLDDPLNCETVASDSSRTTENGLIWDIYTQVGQWLKSDDPTNPLTYGAAGSKVTHAYGWGYSQTGGYLVNYINAVNPLVVAEHGSSVYDAFTVAVAGGAFAGAYPMNNCEPAPPADDPRRQFADEGVPIMRIMAQSDYLRGIGARRPDSDTPGDHYRHYEMAGTGHATPDELYFSAAPEDIVRAGRDVPPMQCDQGPRSRLPNDIFFNAALRNLDLWVRDGIAPPRLDPILVEDGEPVLDVHGNVQGGWRSPYLDVPTSTWSGTATGASFCYIAGWEDPFDEATMSALYPTRDDYITALRDSVRSLENQGLLTFYDAQEIRRDLPENLPWPERTPQVRLTNDHSATIATTFDPFPEGTLAGEVFSGDWDGDGVDTLAYRQGNMFYLARSNATDTEYTAMAYGTADDVVLVGDWDGDGTDTFAVRRGNHYFLSNDFSGGAADEETAYGRAGDEVFVGDWDGDDEDTFAVRRGNTFFLKNDLTGGAADVETAYGRAGDEVLIGDWDADGTDSPSVRRGNGYYLKNSFTGGAADVVTHVGLAALPGLAGVAGDAALIGDWDGDGRDTVGLYRTTMSEGEPDGAAG